MHQIVFSYTGNRTVCQNLLRCVQHCNLENIFIANHALIFLEIWWESGSLLLIFESCAETFGSLHLEKCIKNFTCLKK